MATSSPHIAASGGFSRLALDPGRPFPREGEFSPQEFTDPDALTVGPGFTWHMAAEHRLFREGQLPQLFFLPNQLLPCPDPPFLSPSLPDAGLLPTTSLAEDLACPASHGSQRCPAFFSPPLSTSTCCARGPQLFATSSGLPASWQRRSTRSQHRVHVHSILPCSPSTLGQAGRHPPKGLWVRG